MLISLSWFRECVKRRNVIGGGGGCCCCHIVIVVASAEKERKRRRITQCVAATDVQYKAAGCVELPSLATLLARLRLVVAHDEVINLCRTIYLSCS